MKKILLVTLLILIPSITRAQPTNIPNNVTFTVAADHNGVDTTEYRLYVDGVVNKTVPSSTLVNGTVTITVGPLPTRGTHTLQMTAANEDSESDKSNTVTVNITKPKPGTPGNVKVTVGFILPK